MKPGRPSLSREPLYEEIVRLPRAGRRLRNVSARSLGEKLGYDRETIGVMLRDLETAGRIQRLRDRGRRGTLVRIIDST
jgi:DNA-binding MarR family transcriptional regulator